MGIEQKSTPDQERRQKAWAERSSQVKADLIGQLYSGAGKDKPGLDLTALYPQGLSVMAINALGKFTRSGVLELQNKETGRPVTLNKIPTKSWQNPEFLQRLEVVKVMSTDEVDAGYFATLFPELRAQKEAEAKLPTIGGLTTYELPADYDSATLRQKLAAVPLKDGYTRVYRGIAGQYVAPLSPERMEHLNGHMQQMTELVMGDRERDQIDNPAAALHAATLIGTQVPQTYTGDLEVALGYLHGLKKQAQVGTLIALDIKESDVYNGVGGLKISNQQTPAGYSTNIVVPRALEYAWRNGSAA